MLLKKMFREFFKSKGQFISIILLAFLGVFVYSGLSAMGYGLRACYTDYYEETNFSDYWVYGKGFSEEDVRNVKSISGVSDVQRNITLDTAVSGKESKTITLNILEQNTVNTPKVMEGEPVDLSNSDSIWINQNYAEKNNISTGDSIKLEYGSISLEFTVKGIVLAPEYIYYVASDAIYPDFENLGYAFCSAERLKEEGLSNFVKYNKLTVVSDIEDKDIFEEQISEKLDGGYAVIINRDDFASHNMIAGEFDEARSMSVIFPVIFALIALLTIIITMQRLIKTQRTQIGTLKALGFSNKKIILHYISYGFFTSVIGALLGLVTGPAVMPAMFWSSYKTAYVMPEWKGEFQFSSFAIAVAFIIFCTFSVYFACRKILSENASQELRPEVPPVAKHHVFLNSKWWKKRSFYTQWNLRNLMNSKLKLIIGILGTMSSMGILVSAFLTNDSFAFMKKWMYEDISKYKYQVFFSEDASDEQKQIVIEEINGESMMTGSIVIQKDKNSEKKTSNITVVENGDSDLYSLVDHELNKMSIGDDDFVISEQLADVMGIENGDTVRWHLYSDEEWIESKVTALNRVPMGQGIWLTKNALEKTYIEYNGNIAVTNDDLYDYESDYVSKIYNQDDIHEAWDKGMLALNLMIYMLILSALLLAIVVLYNIGAFSFMESSKEFAQLRVLGFRNKDIRKILVVQNIWLSVFGIIIGIPLGYAILRIVTESAGEDYDFVLSLSPVALVVSAIITLFVGLAVTFMFSKKIKHMNLIEECKGNE